MFGINQENLSQLFNSMSTLANTVFWIRSSDYKKQIYVNSAIEAIYGIPSDQLYNYPDSWQLPIDAKERSKVVNAILQRHHNQVERDDNGDPIYYTLILPNQNKQFIQNTSFTLRNKDHSIVAFAGLSESIPEALYLERTQHPIKNSIDSSQKMLAHVIQQITKDLNSQSTLPILTPSKQKHFLETPLSKREQECVLCLSQGLTAKETAKKLSLSPRTVEAYLESIKNKLGCKTKFEINFKATFGYHLR